MAYRSRARHSIAHLPRRKLRAETEAVTRRSIGEGVLRRLFIDGGLGTWFYARPAMWWRIIWLPRRPPEVGSW